MNKAGLTPLNEDALGECLDALDDIVERMERFPPTLVALALRLHLEALLRTLMEHRLATRQDVRAFLRDLEEDLLTGL